MLLERGVTAAFDSRSHQTFTVGVLAVTDGKGVDIILNSLAGDALAASLKLLKPVSASSYE